MKTDCRWMSDMHHMLSCMTSALNKDVIWMYPLLDELSIAESPSCHTWLETDLELGQAWFGHSSDVMCDSCIMLHSDCENAASESCQGSAASHPPKYWVFEQNLLNISVPTVHLLVWVRTVRIADAKSAPYISGQRLKNYQNIKFRLR